MNDDEDDHSYPSWIDIAIWASIWLVTAACGSQCGPVGSNRSAALTLPFTVGRRMRVASTDVPRSGNRRSHAPSLAGSKATFVTRLKYGTPCCTHRATLLAPSAN